MPPEHMHFSDYQAAFAARIRDPAQAPRPAGAAARRMRVYERLLFNNLDGFLLAAYPITRRLLGARAWKRSVRRFFSEHRSHSPLFRDIPKAFLDWMQTGGARDYPALPFLCEFMHYEWLELCVSIAPEEADQSSIDAEGDLLAGCPALNPSARLACYRYPVHRIGPRYKPREPDTQTWCYLLHRGDDDAVVFTLLNPAAVRLLEAIAGNRQSGHAALMAVAAELRVAAETLQATARQLLDDLRLRGALLGTWKTA